jgi:NAD-dependent DNA ligase
VPVAEFEPIRVGGALLSRATLHNLGRAYGLGLYPTTIAINNDDNDDDVKLIVERSGQVIPFIVGRVDAFVRPPPSSSSSSSPSLSPQTELIDDDDDKTSLIDSIDYNDDIALLKPRCPCHRQSILLPHARNSWRCIDDICFGIF